LMYSRIGVIARRSNEVLISQPNTRPARDL
jgi:hypothetical protein